ncbi:AraC family transcriptional regulator [Telluribacter sp. SYSU D00476]|uniref:AraC family transcriptional regulator n=1 Tax=Telluribacter sp. SYSU D00476 TaxID=2811430 RepID=UPI001FF5E0D4|nr:AraC family transcriptional regulator [Telluribacter sp. SYSU D00476]
MKPQLLKVPVATECSFSVRQDVVQYFYNKWHYHPEIELVYIEEGRGTQFIGNSIQNFEAGDILVIGSNLPHYWRCNQEYFERDDLVAKATVVHFQECFWGSTFLKLPENRRIYHLIEQSKRGIRLNGRVKEKIKYLLKQLLVETGSSRIILLLQILTDIAHSEDLEYLSNVDYPRYFDETDTERINKIYTYSLANFQRKVTLEEIAAVAHMSPNSFCRYFKSRTGKAYFQFLLELRVNNACKLLVEEKLSIAQVCFESGFNQFSGFNRYFKQITGKSPTQYQRSFVKGV